MRYRCRRIEGRLASSGGRRRPGRGDIMPKCRRWRRRRALDQDRCGASYGGVLDSRLRIRSDRRIRGSALAGRLIGGGGTSNGCGAKACGHVNRLDTGLGGSSAPHCGAGSGAWVAASTEGPCSNAAGASRQSPPRQSNSGPCGAAAGSGADRGGPSAARRPRPRRRMTRRPSTPERSSAAGSTHEALRRCRCASSALADAVTFGRPAAS